MREKWFQQEMRQADTMRKLLSESGDYDKSDVIKKYMTLLRKCYHGEKFESSDGVYKCGEVLPLEIAQSMFDEFERQLESVGLCCIDLENICCDEMKGKSDGQ